MDATFICVLFCIELASLIFKSIHTATSELHVYSAYNQLPVVYHESSKAYSCFASLNYCVYGSRELRWLKILDLFFILTIVVCYGCLVVILNRQRENTRIRSDSTITWYTVLQLITLFALALHTLLIIIFFERDTLKTDRCNKQSRLIRIENLFNHFALSILEVAYLTIDLVNRQSSFIRVPVKQTTNMAPASEQIRLPATKADYRLVKTVP